MPGPHDSPDSVTSTDSPAERFFVDGEGTRWRVFEQVNTVFDRRRSRSLIFASESAVRRVREFPENWITLSDDELLALSWKA